MNVQEAYKVLQDSCGIEVGNTVKVLRIAEDLEMGWNTAWVEEMDDVVGNVYEVIDIDPKDGIQLDTDGGSWYFPFFVLEKIKDAIEEDVLEVTMQDVEDEFGCKVKIIKGEDDEVDSV